MRKFSTMADLINIKNLNISTTIGSDAWGRHQPQTCLISLKLGTDFQKSSTTDDLNYSLNYATICRDVRNLIKKKLDWVNLCTLTNSITSTLCNTYPGIKDLKITVQALNTHLRTNDISYEKDIKISSPKDMIPKQYDLLHIRNLELFTLIGVFTFERLQKQKISLNIILPWLTTNREDVPYASIINNVVKYVENSNFKTVEALVESVSKLISQEQYYQNILDLNLPILVEVIKHSAIMDTDGVGVSCTRTLKELNAKQYITLNAIDQIKSTDSSFDLPVENDSMKTLIPNTWNTAYLAFGSNIGDKLQYIESAITILSNDPKIKITQTSSLFESEPMYFKDQDPFMNGCIQIKTKYLPQELLSICKEIEYDELKRVKHFDNGPRCIDLDIILYLNSSNEHITINEPNLVIPHPRMLERSFVLEPLCELISPDHIHPITAEPIWNHLDQLYANENDEDSLWKVIPLPNMNSQPRFLKFKSINKINKMTNQPYRETVSPTYLMGILNVTPDSFSDGGEHFSTTTIKEINFVKEMCVQVFQLHESIIIDIGGCSTRPGSIQATLEEELKRTIPVIKAIRSCNELPQEKIILSIDTYRAEVARQSIEAGVDIVNDISGGLFDDGMFKVIAANPRVSYVLSHIRGDISNMNKMNKYTNTTTDNEGGMNLIEYINGKECDIPEAQFMKVIGRELSQRYKLAIANGIRRWQIILDPGIGFAKDSNQNLQIIRDIPILKNYSCSEDGDKETVFANFKNIPILLGPSRKKFIGKITKDEDPVARDFATGSIVASCVGFGTNIVRVHDIKDCSKTIKLADTLYRKI
ncbi:trifunctional dihydropteroate synthetase/dihydrohydroxymethylpterin pyrophosphokinase/dihydroneopterin aldolase FOL1 NDAI_0F04090 [Naumovozyma dairenensis CBS 421]|uniref:Folic acid synthesis protein fol1 n=1 Tax=Naumovozyma dairenensis (strain ATCC 10597 / BCRC 20456 / CBS 421 / NBRC 0211 / NRRL Y-12639) TaxID=1071378 RepID=G0WD66_NAUDC|nr:hypothetical protein NDAI_0F04090 [Naumovozyma dairenensis CBS 421]CCD25727.1 hypothetical protein NDAI_0F04090 [Naumovozyma dairenensis CBS 421]